MMVPRSVAIAAKVAVILVMLSHSQIGPRTAMKVINAGMITVTRNLIAFYHFEGKVKFIVSPL